MTEPAAKQKFSFIEMLGEHPGKFASAGLVAVVPVWGFYLWQFSDGLSDSQETWGQFGDFVGGTLNSVFGFLGFLILLSSLRLQAKELAEAGRELKAASEAQKAQVNHFEREAKKSDYIQAIRFMLEHSKLDHARLNINKKPDGAGGFEVVGIFHDSYPIKNSSNLQSIISEEQENRIKNEAKKYEILDKYCYPLYKYISDFPILIDCVIKHQRVAENLHRRGWITDLKFFGKHDLPFS